MEYCKTKHSYCDASGFRIIKIHIVITVLLIGLCFVLQRMGFNIEYPFLIAAASVITLLLWPAFFLGGNIYWIKDGAVCYYDHFRKVRQLPKDVSSIIVLNGVQGRYMESAFRKGEVVGVPQIALCSGDASLYFPKYI